MRRAFVILAIASIMSGCETTDDTLTTSVTPNAITGPTAGAIAGDMASRLAEQVGPANTIAIKMDKDNSDYAAALEAALKGWGYSVIVNGKVPRDQKLTQLSWSIDTIDGQLFARLATPSIALGRAYLPTTVGATPASPLSIMQRN